MNYFRYAINDEIIFWLVHFFQIDFFLLNYISIDSRQVQTLDSNSLELPQSLNHILDFAKFKFLDLLLFVAHGLNVKVKFTSFCGWGFCFQTSSVSGAEPDDSALTSGWVAQILAKLRHSAEMTICFYENC